MTAERIASSHRVFNLEVFEKGGKYLVVQKTWYSSILTAVLHCLGYQYWERVTEPNEEVQDLTAKSLHLNMLEEEIRCIFGQELGKLPIYHALANLTIEEINSEAFPLIVKHHQQLLGVKAIDIEILKAFKSKLELLLKQFAGKSRDQDQWIKETFPYISHQFDLGILVMIDIRLACKCWNKVSEQNRDIIIKMALALRTGELGDFPATVRWVEKWMRIDANLLRYEFKDWSKRKERSTDDFMKGFVRQCLHEKDPEGCAAATYLHRALGQKQNFEAVYKQVAEIRKGGDLYLIDENAFDESPSDKPIFSSFTDDLLGSNPEKAARALAHFQIYYTLRPTGH